MKHRARSLLLLASSLAMACGSTVITGDAATDVAQDASTHDVPVVTDVTPVNDVPPSVDVPVVTDVPLMRDVPVGPDAGRVPMQHRPNNDACLTTPAAGNCMLTGGPPTICTMDSQCTMGTNGRCVFSGGGVLSCMCAYDTCTTDSECTMGGPCACHTSAYNNGGNTCAPGNCHIDSDCGPNGYCSPSINTMGCGSLGGYYCHTAMDTCLDAGDCPMGSEGPQVCVYSTSAGRWQCAQELLCG